MRKRRLILDHLPLAAKIAAGMAKRMPVHVDRRDVLQDACVGLLQAAKRFDRKRSVEFGAYARRRIAGAVLDGQRREDHLSRDERRKARQQSAVAREDQQCWKPGREPIPPPETLPAIGAGAEAQALRAELRAVLGLAISTLLPRDQFVLRSYYGGQRTMRQIAGLLHVSESQVWNSHYRALVRLRRYLAERGLALEDLLG